MSAANLYYAQPVLSSIARSFHTNSSLAGLIVTLSQIGYAAGLAFLVPVGDIVTRRRFVPVLLLVSAAALLASASAPGIGLLIGVAAVVGGGSVAAQVLVPMAASLADEQQRGQVVGTVMSGLLMGILLARTVSGLVAGVSNWRVVYVVAATLTTLTAALLARFLPSEGDRPRIGYGALLASVVRLLASDRVLQRRAVYGALGFAAFSAFWTTMAFLLAAPPYHYGDLTIGLFGLVGAAGALCANFAGRWADQGLTRLTTLAFAVCTGVAFLPLWWGRHSLTMLIIGIVVMDVGVQGLQVTNQSMIYRSSHETRSRVTSAYMVCYFAGGALGSALGAEAYSQHGWAGVCVFGGAIGAFATAGALIGMAHRPE
jgi:predicted MFS family arabinose efflux permease